MSETKLRNKEKRKLYPNSIDFSTVENVVYRQEERRKIRQGESQRELGMRFLVALSVGLVVGLQAYTVRIGTDKLYEWKFDSLRKYTTAGPIPSSPVDAPIPEQNGTIWVGFLIFLVWNWGLCLLGCTLVVLVAPAAGGSGIPDVKGYLNGSVVAKAFNVVTLCVKWIGVILSVSSSLAVGPEGPMIHLGAMIGGGLGEMRSRTMGFKMKFFRHYRNTADRRDFISVGAASGVSAAFGAPIGGLLFSMEEASSFWSIGLTWRAFLGAFAANWMLNFCVAATKAKYRFLPKNDLLFPHGQSQGFEAWEYLPFFFLGIVGGLLGFAFTYLNIKLMAFRLRVIFKKKYLRFLEVVLIVFVTSLISFALPLLWPCKFTPLENVKGFHVDDAEQFTCRQGHYNEMASLLWAPQDSAVKRLLSRSTIHLFSPTTCICFCLIYFIMACATAGSSISSGLVVPMMLIGCSYGRFTALMLNQYAGVSVDPGTYALVGCASFIGGVSRMTMSMTVILVEVTGDTELVLPIMMVILTAKTLADRLTHPLYETLLELRHIPYLENEPSPYMAIMPVTCIMNTPVLTLNAVEPVKKIVQVLTETQHCGFPVLHSKTGTQIGMISRKYLLVLLWAVAVDQKRALSHEDFLLYLDEVHMRKVDIENIESKLKGAVAAQLLYISQYMDLCPPTVSATFTVAAVLRMIRTMGLRHLTVVNHFNVPIGMVTRKDLLEEHVTECYRENMYEIHHNDPAACLGTAEWPLYVKKLQQLYVEQQEAKGTPDDDPAWNLVGDFLKDNQANEYRPGSSLSESFEAHATSVLSHPSDFRHFQHTSPARHADGQPVGLWDEDSDDDDNHSL
eukprot:TRINITY_DN2416_c0_g1_i1.p1 TRINITY_DN2416_c0_g1~~TRINITY_DN2416_c0_g1_i1.p1  ORF type:complete len:854 (+),score=47.42 TRINITY_DN2416_c0_g1_i1:29-2563(+)